MRSVEKELSNYPEDNCPFSDRAKDATHEADLYFHLDGITHASMTSRAVGSSNFIVRQSI